MDRKVCLVTGGLKGIGRAISAELAACGFITYAVGRELSDDIEVEPGVIPLRMDVRKEEEVARIFESIRNRHEKLDVLINNAGISTGGPFENTVSREWEDVFHTNVFGTLLCTQKSFDLMKQEGGRIINISSIVTQRTLANSAVYTASKQAVNGMAQVLAEEWYPNRIMTTTLYVGATYTDLWKGVSGFSPSDMLQASDVARVVSFIAQTPLQVRIDEMTLTPPKGLL
jgi:3-oxoacyl-[acyl-carrier protein] reductase